MILFSIFILCISFFILIQESNIKLWNYDMTYTSDQLKSVCSFLRSSSKIECDQNFGLSSSFFTNSITLKKVPQSNVTPFESPLLSLSAENFTSFLDYNHKILVNNSLISNYSIKYYSQFLINNTSLKSNPRVLHPINPNSKIMNYII